MKSSDRQQKYLEGLYSSGGNRIIILYGQKYSGKKSLIEAFTKDKPSVSYSAAKCEDRQQRRIMGSRFSTESEYPEYRDIFLKMTEKSENGRLVISVFDFEFLIRTDSSFLQSLVDYASSGVVDVSLMVLLVSGSVGFVENELVKKAGSLALSFAGFLKIADCPFSDVREFFPEMSPEDRIGIYALLGGRIGLFPFFDREKALRKNIESVILDSRGALRNEAELRLSRHLRETAVYSSILMSVATGDQKLNDIYKTTGFSRAKISVYLENLTALEAAEKVFSEETKGMDNAKKGIYAVSDPLLLFWYRYVFPHLSELAGMKPEEFYDAYIAEDFDAFCERAFRDAVSQYALDSSDIPHSSGRFGIWEGKKGRIDLLSENEDGNWTVGLCSWEKPVMDGKQYEVFLSAVKSAKVQVSHTVLAAREGFSPALTALGRRDDVTLLTMKDIDAG